MTEVVKHELVCDFAFHVNGGSVRWEIFNNRGGIAATTESDCDRGWKPVKHACECCGDRILQVLDTLNIKHTKWPPSHEFAALPRTELGRIFIV